MTNEAREAEERQIWRVALYAAFTNQNAGVGYALMCAEQVLEAYRKRFPEPESEPDHGSTPEEAEAKGLDMAYRRGYCDAWSGIPNTSNGDLNYTEGHARGSKEYRKAMVRLSEAVAVPASFGTASSTPEEAETKGREA
jgi:hypothetical protein